jgi:hypothetical protein
MWFLNQIFLLFLFPTVCSTFTPPQPPWPHTGLDGEFQAPLSPLSPPPKKTTRLYSSYGAH